MDKITIKGLDIFANHGVYPEEAERGQKFLVDITIFFSTRMPGITDNLDDTVNYGELAGKAAAIFTGRRFDLIEAAAENLACELLKNYPEIGELEITVHKPDAPIKIPFEDVTVTIRRKWNEVYIAVGSNIGDSYGYIEKARKIISERDDVIFIKSSSLITTKPYGVTDQPDFVNGMWYIKTLLPPRELLSVLNMIEAECKRERTIHWGPRTLDLDIIYYGDEVISDADLIIPHVDMHNRDFVLKPLLEIAPGKRHPVTGATPAMMLEDLKVPGSPRTIPDEGVKKYKL